MIPAGRSTAVTQVSGYPQCRQKESEAGLTSALRGILLQPLTHNLLQKIRSHLTHTACVCACVCVCGVHPLTRTLAASGAYMCFRECYKLHEGVYFVNLTSCSFSSGGKKTDVLHMLMNFQQIYCSVHSDYDLQLMNQRLAHK